MPKPAINTVHGPVRHRFGVASPRRDGTGVPVGRGAVPKTGQKTPFATTGCLWNTCGHGRRAEEPIDDPFATPGCLRTTCSRGCRAKPGREPDYNPVNGTDSLSFGTRPCPKSASVEGRRAEDRPEDPLCHARMPLRYLWVGSPCQSADRSPLRHAGISLRYLWKGSPCQRPVRASVSCRSLTGRLALCHARMPLRHP